jgi:urease accessory protein
MLIKVLLVSVVLQISLLAHTGAGSVSGFSAGFGHPIGGMDHILAMFAVGLWAAQMGGRAMWSVPLAFVTMMIVGTFLGLQGIQVPFIEEGILLSVVVVGAMIGLGIKMPMIFSALLVGIFAIFHGTAHGAEIPLNVSHMEYVLGFVLATALLHGAGIVTTMAIHKLTVLKTVHSSFQK